MTASSSQLRVLLHNLDPDPKGRNLLNKTPLPTIVEDIGLTIIEHSGFLATARSDILLMSQARYDWIIMYIGQRTDSNRDHEDSMQVVFFFVNFCTLNLLYKLKNLNIIALTSKRLISILQNSLFLL